MSDSSTMTMSGPRGAGRPRATARAAERRGSRRAVRSGGKAESGAKKKAVASVPDRARAAVEGAAERAGRWKAPLAVLVVALVVVVALYAPAKGLYAAWRTNEARQAQLDELNASNEGYRSDISRLQTREGIEDEARKRGYVNEGETSVIVEGLPTEDGSSDAAPAEVPWYIALGDFVFQYEEG